MPGQKLCTIKYLLPLRLNILKILQINTWAVQRIGLPSNEFLSQGRLLSLSATIAL